MDGWFDRKKRVVMEKSLKRWGRNPDLLVDLVVNKRLQMHQEEEPEEVLLDTAPLAITFAPMAIFPLNGMPYVVNWGGFPVFQGWVVEVFYVPVVIMPVSAPSDLDVRVYSQI